MSKRLFIFLLALITLPIILLAQKQIQQLLGLAAPREANIIIETKNVLGPINKSWAAFSQGGEEAPPNLAPVVSKMKELSPRFIRLDHIYDANNVVSKNGNVFTYDFSILDKAVNDIINMGALPFFSLSYMPKDFTSSGSIIDTPTDWETWKNLVKATIEHYSGKNNRNLTEVYYEVWNEPELPQFGSWKLENPKDYRQLYFYASDGASQAVDVNKFYLGGPAVGSYYPSWINNFVSYIAQNNLRLDFYSWHRYTKKPFEYVQDAQNTRNLLSSFRTFAKIPLILTEWGIDSENSEINNTNTTAAYTIFSAAKFYNDINLAFNFEVKDGPAPTGGNWGLLAHESNPNQPLSPKPKFKAFATLAKLSGNQIMLSGDDTYVSGIASSTTKNIAVILTNYDSNGKNIENVPVTFTGLSPGIYDLKYNYPLDNRNGFFEIPVTSGNVSKNFLMPSNSIVFLELTKLSQMAIYIDGSSTLPTNKALILDGIDGPLMFSTPEFHLLPVGSISFDIKPFWDKNDNRSFFILEAPFEVTDGTFDKLSLSKQVDLSENLLVLSISQQNQLLKISKSISNWEPNTWHHLELGWDQDGFWLSDNGKRIESSTPLDIRNGKTLTFSPIEAAIDNLKITVGKDLGVERNFDGRVDK